MALFLVILLGAIFRFTNLNWDAGGRLHPDEALLVQGVQTIKFFSRMFPGFHDYNGLPVYLLKLFSLGITDPAHITLVGRFLSALFSTATIPIVYLIGKKLWHINAGLLAAILFACTPLSIQLAHFYTTESILVFLFSLLIYYSLLNSTIGMAIATGLAIATKNTAFLFLPIPLVKTNNRLLFLFMTFLCFFIFSPYSFIDVSGYITRWKYLQDVVTGSLLMDWTMQFQNTNALFWFPTVLYAFGPIIFVAFPKHRVLTLWTIGFIIFLGFTYLKFIRYSAPLMPLFSLFAAKLVWDNKKLLLPLVVLQFVWAIMFFQIYLAPHTSHFAAHVIPKNAKVLSEEWNSIIKYPVTTFNFYTLPDTKEKMQKLTDALEKSDYFIMQSPKVKNTIKRLKTIYPYMDNFYENLEDRTLGFEKVAEFSSFPTIGPLVINDEHTEETWTVFDHPSITIYKKL